MGYSLHAGMVIVADGTDARAERLDRVLTVDPGVGVARHAKAQSVPTVLLAGSLGEGHEELYQHGVASILCISDGAMTFQQALSRTGTMLEGTAERAVRLFLLSP